VPSEPASRSLSLPTAGTLLVALPTLEQPEFHRTVILMLAFGASEGALGVVLNRPNEVPVGDLLPGWEELAAPPESVFVGGPVSRDAVICLASMKAGAGAGEAPVDGCAPIPGGPDGLATLDLHRQPYEMTPAVHAVRLFSGYAGWSAGQLEQELATGSWLVVPSTSEDAFTDDPDGLWARVLRRQGGHVALYADAPPKLWLN
jgi:putative transcriptional regulator